MHKIRPPLVPSHIFKQNDIRGAYPSELNEKGAYAVARSFVNYALLRKPDHQKIQVVVSHDGNDSSLALYNAFIGGLLDEGADVIDIGVAIPSIHSLAIAYANADGGASFAVVSEDISNIVLSSAGAAPIGEGLGLEEIRNAALRGIFVSTGGSATLQSGVRIQKDFLNEYIEYFAKEFQELQNVSIKIAITGSERMVAMGKKIMERFPNVDCTDTGGVSIPGDMGIFLGEDEEVIFFDERGMKVSIDAMAAFFVGEYAASGDHVAYDLRLSRAIAEAANTHGVEAVSCRVGNVFLRDCMQRNNAICGVDALGHFYFQDFFCAASGIFALFVALSILAQNSKSFSELIAPYQRYAKSPEMSFTIKNKEQCMDSLAAFFHDAALSYEDGLSVAHKDWWCNVRLSTTEDVLRVNIEADDSELLDKKIKLLSELIEKYT